MWVEFSYAVVNLYQGEVLFVQGAYKFLHAAKTHFMQLWMQLLLGICKKKIQKMPII